MAPKKTPVPKVTPGPPARSHRIEQRVTLGAAVAGLVALIGWGMNSYVLPADKPLTIEAGAGLTGLLTFIAQWWTRGRLS